jgi:hypothetical protein
MFRNFEEPTSLGGCKIVLEDTNGRRFFQQGFYNGASVGHLFMRCLEKARELSPMSLTLDANDMGEIRAWDEDPAPVQVGLKEVITIRLK